MRGSDSASCFAARIRVRTQLALPVSRISDLWNRFSLLWKHCSHRNSDLVTVVTFKVTITVTHLTEIAWRTTRASDSSPRA